MGFDHRHYVPILKGKKGELMALAKAEKLQQFTPLVEVIPIPLAYTEEGKRYSSKTIDKHIKDTADSFIQAMGVLSSVFIDGVYIESEVNLHDGTHPALGLFSRLRAGGIKFVPTIGIDRVGVYADAVSDSIAKDKRGCCLRLWQKDLESISDLEKQIDALLNELKVDSSHVDLLVDFESKVPPKVTLPFLIDALPRLSEWRTLTLSCSSFPETLAEVGSNTIKELERSEWEAWIFVRQKSAGKRIPTFSDYGVSHPSLTDDLDPRIVTMSPNIRYTSSASYVVAKGKAQPRKKKAQTAAEKAGRQQLAPSVQYPKLANMIKNHSSWKGRAFSWGDQFVDRCSQRACVGTPSDWRGVGASHHIAVVVQQIANLP